MIRDADCLSFDKESIYSDLGLQGIFKIYIAFDYLKLPLFAKIIQSFILMPNT